MFQTFKLMNLDGALKAKGNAQEAYSAVLELGRIGNNRAVDLLLSTLRRMDGVARSAARELGKLQNDRAISPLLELLGQPEVNQAAADALLAYGPKAVGPLMDALRNGNRLGPGAPPPPSANSAILEPWNRSSESCRRMMSIPCAPPPRPPSASSGLPRRLGAGADLATARRDDSKRQSALERLRHATQLCHAQDRRSLCRQEGCSGDYRRRLAEQALEEVEQRLGETETHPRLLQDPKRSIPTSWSR
jgi:hypothetical protein